MEEPTPSSPGTRRDQDIALDMMKFIAVTTGYGRAGSPGAGFQGGAGESKAEDYARHLSICTDSACRPCRERSRSEVAVASCQ